MNVSQTVHDRNLLFGILAVQMDFVSQSQLIETMQAWLLQKSKPLAQLLVERGILSEERRQLLANLVREHVRQHANDPQQSLAAIGPGKELRDELTSLRDPYVSRIVSRLPAAANANPGGDFLPTMPHAVTRESISTRRYVAVRPLAEGGLGKVSVALDTEVSREVALKEIKPFYADNLDSRARFLKEAEITGRLEHPGIVPVYGLGTYDDGRPYYAMRMITGCSLKEAIAEFYELDKQPRESGERRLALCELLQRFIGVCHAVEFAHSRGIIHRDLKPANVMLGNFRETLVVDWGLAKAVGELESTQRTYDTVIVPELGGESIPTRVGEVVGTVGFMSPEQASGKLREMGPPSDIYSLGATLYNLLTGAIPHAGADLGEQLRNIIQGKFAKPRVANRKVAPTLEAVCLKAMALSPRDRYPSARALADDVEKYLADEPTVAHRESWSERLARWERRNRSLVRAVAASLLIVAMLAVGFAVIFQKQKQKAQDQEQLALKAEARAKLTLQLLVDIFKRPDPDQDGKSVTIYEVLRGTADNVSKLAKGDLELEAELNLAIGKTLLGLDLADDAVPLLERAHEGFIAANGVDYPERLTNENNLASAYSAANQLEKALPLLQRNLDLTRQQLGPDHEDTLNAMNNLAAAYQKAARWDESLPLLEESLTKMRAKFGAEDPRTLAVMNNLASNYQALNQMAKALPLFEQNATIMRTRQGTSHPTTLISFRNLAVAYQAAGQLEKALELARETWNLRKSLLGDSDPQTLRVQRLMAGIEVEQQAYTQAESTIRDVLAKLEPIKEKQGSDIAKAHITLGDALLGKEDFAAAESAARLASAYYSANNLTSFEKWHAQSMLATALAGKKEFATAEPLLRECQEQFKGKWESLQPTQRHVAIRACERLMTLYAQTNQSARLESVRQDLERMKAKP